MSRNVRQALIGAILLISVGSACKFVTGAFPAPGGTASPSGQMATPSATPADLAQIPLIPITGENVVAMQCQFCVANETHAILIFPDTASFDVDGSSPVTCMTADVVSNRRIIICRGPESTTFNLKICSDSSNCLEFPVALQPCALLQGRPTPSAPTILTPLPRHKSNNDSNQSSPGSTAVPPPVRATNPPPPIVATQPPPQATKEPKPTHKPKPTKKPKPAKHKP